MFCNRLHALRSTQLWLATLLSSLIARRWVGLQTLWRLRLKDLSIDEMVEAGCFGCCQVHRGLPVGFLLLWYSVSFTVESFSLLYLLVISWLICSRRWCIDKLGVFHANQISMSWSTSELRVRLARLETGLSPPGKIFYWPFQGGASFVYHLCYFCLVFVMLSCASVYWCLAVTCWKKPDLFALVCDV